MSEKFHFLDMKIQEELRQRREKSRQPPSTEEKVRKEMKRFQKLLPIGIPEQESEEQVLPEVSVTEVEPQSSTAFPMPPVEPEPLVTEPEGVFRESIEPETEMEKETETRTEIEPEISVEQIKEEQVEEEKAEDKRIISVEEQLEEEKALNDFEISLLINQLRFPMNKKRRLNIIEKLSKYVVHPLVKSLFLELAYTETITLARAKVISALSDIVHDEDAKNVLINALRDSSPVVRQWAVWGLMQLVEKDSDIVERLIYHLLYREGSKRVKLWILRSLSRTINQSAVEDTFLRLLSPSAPYEIRSLIVDYLLQRLDDNEICYAISRYVQKEPNKELKKRIIKKIVDAENTDLKFALERLKFEERNKEILNLLKNTS
ncbi:MAG: HEAT repeat domain-containing protein [Candidatus Heimdallarchaeaceae archaeon]